MNNHHDSPRHTEKARLEKLNPPQREAVITIEGPLLVLAGAGTGKTRVVTERLAHLLRHGARPDEILAVTFTNKAAAEMRERVAKIVGQKKKLDGLVISTFHSLCVRILRRDAAAVGYRPDFTICDQGEQMGLVRKASRHVAADAKGKPEDILAAISRLKNAGVDQTQANRQARDDEELVLANVYRRYQDNLRVINAVDFDDLLILALAALEKDAAACDYWQDRGRYIMVDEFQDTNEIQYRLVRRLAAKHGNLCVVGDDDQSIYGWRGAVARNILDFNREYPTAKVVTLEENYRSVSVILKAANAVIAHNEERRPKNLWSRLGDGGLLPLWICEDQQEEAERVVADIRKRINGGEKPSAFAIIVRANAQTRPFEEELRIERLPYAIIGGSSFFDRKEVRDTLAYLTVVANSRADAALLRIINTPSRGLGDKTVEALSAHARRANRSLLKALREGAAAGVGGAAAAAAEKLADQFAAWRELAKNGCTDLVRRILTDTEYERELEHLYDDPLDRANRYNSALEVQAGLDAHLQREPGNDLSGFLQEMMISGREQSEKKEPDEAVRLITVHSAKGLEFGVVYLVGMEEGLLPHKNAEEGGTIPEERRLCYVAITRARRELILSYCNHRINRGQPVARAASRFLEEIPAELICSRDQAAKREEIGSVIAAVRARLEGGALPLDEE